MWRSLFVAFECPVAYFVVVSRVGMCRKDAQVSFRACVELVLLSLLCRRSCSYPVLLKLVSVVTPLGRLSRGSAGRTKTNMGSFAPFLQIASRQMCIETDLLSPLFALTPSLPFTLPYSVLSFAILCYPMLSYPTTGEPDRQGAYGAGGVHLRSGGVLRHQRLGKGVKMRTARNAFKFDVFSLVFDLSWRASLVLSRIGNCRSIYQCRRCISKLN